MIARLAHLRNHPAVFRHLTGLTVDAFDDLVADVGPAVDAAVGDRRAARRGRRRAVGAGHPFALGTADRLLATVVWLRHDPTEAALGYLFGASDSAARRAVLECLPPLERAGRDAMRMPDPGRGRRRRLPALLRDTPGLAVVVDTFEQRVQRPTRGQRAYYSGKRKRHTLKSQVAVDEATGRVAHVGDSRPGRWADVKVLRRSGLRAALPPGVGVLGDRAYRGVAAWHPAGLGATPRQRRPGKPRPPADRRYNRAFNRRRVVVEHAIGRLRRFRALDHADRHHRRHHAARVRAAAGLVNRMVDRRLAAA